MGAARPDRRVSVLQVLPCDATGGTEQMVGTLMERFDRERIKVTLATLDRPGPVARRAVAAGLRVDSLGGRGFAVASWRLARLMRSLRPDVVVAYGFKATMAARLIARGRRKRPVFVSGVRGLHVTDVIDTESRRSRAVLRAERALSRLVDVYVCNSPGAVELLAAAGVDRERLRYVPNGIDVDRWPAVDPAKQETPVVICVARLTPIKRHVDLLAATRLLRDRGRDLQLVLVGDGPSRPELEHSVAESGLGERVRFAGRQDPEGVRRELAGAQVFCLASAWEGMPGSVMEAMASELPVVGTDVNGIRHVVAHEQTGLLVSPGDPDALAAALERLLADADLRGRLGRAGRARMASEFSLDKVVGQTESLYMELAG